MTDFTGCPLAPETSPSSKRKKQAINMPVREDKTEANINQSLSDTTADSPLETLCTIATDPASQTVNRVASHLKLVVSNPILLPRARQAIDLSIKAPFKTTAKAYKTGGYLMKAEDPSHFIKCNLSLVIREAHEEQKFRTVICSFPAIDYQQLSDFVWNDETLYGVLAIRFQMKVLEQLMLFCAGHMADTLVLAMPVKQADEFEVYQNCVVAQQHLFTPYGKKIQMTIPASAEQYDAWIDFMEETKLRFSQTLWSEQRFNPAVKHYLKTHKLSDI